MEAVLTMDAVLTYLNRLPEKFLLNIARLLAGAELGHR
jgi:hypothetical protein